MSNPKRLNCLLLLLTCITPFSWTIDSQQTGAGENRPQALASPSSSGESAANPNPARSSTTDSNKLEPIKIQKAIYPLEAAQKGIQGQVLVRIVVSETGQVADAEVISGDPVLAKSALEAVKKWEFKPFIKNGKPIKVATKVPVDFAFEEKVKDVRDEKPETEPRPASASVAVPKRVRVSQGVTRGLLIHKVQPIYPLEARSNGIQGTVILRALIGKDGRIHGLTPVSGPTELIPAAIGAVQQWRYKPYVLEGERVEVETQITVNFELR
jgi:TonB family protein